MELQTYNLVSLDIDVTKIQIITVEKYALKDNRIKKITGLIICILLYLYNSNSNISSCIR